MKSVFVKSAVLGMFAATTLLVGCGGGGGGGGSFTPPEISNTPVTIDSSNQYQVADAADNGVNGAVNGAPGVLGVVIDGNGSSFNAFDFAQSSLKKYAGQVTLGQATPTGISQTEACDAAPGGATGSQTFSSNITDTSATSFGAGDYLSISFSNCYDSSDGTTTNGSMKFTIVQGGLNFSTSSTIGLTEISANFNNLRVTDSGGTNVVHGGFSVSTDGSTESLTGDSLYVMVVGGEAVHLTNFTITNTTANTSTDTISVDFTIASTDINGVITVATDPSNPLIQGITDQHPYSGTLIITGSTSKLTMIITGSNSVTLELDSNGDDVVDATANVTWTDIDNGALAVL